MDENTAWVWFIGLVFLFTIAMGIIGLYQNSEEIDPIEVDLDGVEIEPVQPETYPKSETLSQTCAERGIEGFDCDD